jgi:hypothetical protein
MMGRRKRDQGKLFYEFRLEDRIRGQKQTSIAVRRLAIGGGDLSLRLGRPESIAHLTLSSARPCTPFDAAAMAYRGDL